MTVPSIDKLRKGAPRMRKWGGFMCQAVSENLVELAASYVEAAMKKLSAEERQALRRQVTTWRGTTFSMEDMPPQEPVLLTFSREVLAELLRQGVLSWSLEDADCEAVHLAEGV